MRIVVELQGGLGNQMFQYAAGRGIAHTLGADLAFEKWTGFVRDYRYKRKYSLAAISDNVPSATLLEKTILFTEKVLGRKLAKSKQCPIVANRFLGRFVYDPKDRFDAEVFRLGEGTSYLKGYWQSPRYFADIASSCLKEVHPKKPDTTKYSDMGEHLKAHRYVALGLRVYEETVDPSRQAYAGRAKSADQLQAALDSILTEAPETRVAVFCTHRAELLNALKLPLGTIYITGEEGFIDAAATLWLLTQCQHHLFTNSTFYWWGAFLSTCTHGTERQIVCASDNFFNRDAYPPEWRRF